MRYPGNYGFIPHTLSDDGDPCDVIVANTRAIIPGAVMSCSIVGVLFMEDEAGGDEKMLAVPSAKLTQRYAKVDNYTDLPEITLKQIEHFFAHYKDLEPGKWVKIVALGRRRRGALARLAGIERARAQAPSVPPAPPRARRRDAALVHRSPHRRDAEFCERHASACRRSRCGTRRDYRADRAARRASRRPGSAGISSSSSPARLPRGLSVFTLRMGDWRSLSRGRGRLTRRRC